ncbi:MAG: DUF4013 domain-containing protein [Chloroflexi bacterium]|nr:DUF4013 domain-containing protein [Chloroflexota bacterium]
MNIGRAFTYMFEDESWFTKMLILVFLFIFMFFLIPLPIIAGYLLAVAANVMRGDNRLPSWDRIGQYFVDGLKFLVALFVYLIPIIIIAGLLGLTVGGGAKAFSTTPGPAWGRGLSPTMLLIQFLVWLYSAFVGPALAVLFLKTGGNFAQLFNIGRFFSIITTCLGGLIMVLLVSMGLGFVLSIIAGILMLIPCLGWLLTLFLAVYPSLVMGHLYGQLARTCPA